MGIHRGGVISTGSLLFVLLQLSRNNYNVSATCNTNCDCSCMSHRSNDTSLCSDVKSTNLSALSFADCQDLCQMQGGDCDAHKLVCVTIAIHTQEDPTCMPELSSPTPTLSPSPTVAPSSGNGTGNDDDNNNYNNTCTCFCKSCTADSTSFLTISACELFCGQRCEGINDNVFECHSSEHEPPSPPATSTASAPTPPYWKHSYLPSTHASMSTLRSIQACLLQSITAYFYAWLLL